MRSLFLIAMAAAAAEWPQFRGPNAAGTSRETGLPEKFGPTENVIWKTLLPPGASSPAITGGTMFVTAYDGPKLLTIAIDRQTGRVMWRRDLAGRRNEIRHKLNDPASSSPVTDGRNVYSFFGNFGLASYGPDGEERWRLPLGPFNNLHGMAASPIYWNGKIFMSCDQDTDAQLVAVDAKSGKVAWKTARPEVQHGFSTPVLYEPERGEAQVIVPGSYSLIGYSAESGRKLWWARGLTWQPKSPPVIGKVKGQDVLFFNGWAPGADPGEEADVPAWAEVLPKFDKDGDGKLSVQELPKEYQPPGSLYPFDLDRDGVLNEREWEFYRLRRGSRNGLLAVRLGGSGDVTDTHVMWRFTKSIPDVPAPLFYKDLLFLVRTGGIATTVNPETGVPIKQGRLTGAVDDYYSSPVAADGKVYMISKGGVVSILTPTGQWEITRQNQLDDEVFATPAIADGRLYIRTRSALYCFGLRR